MKNTVNALKQLVPYVVAILGTIVTAFIITVMFGIVDETVVPALNLTINASNASLASTATSAILVAGADGVYNMAAIVLISTGLMALATVMTAFGFKRFERFDIGASRLAGLIKRITNVLGIYASIIFILAVFRIILGYLEEKLLASLGLSTATWLGKLSLVVALGTTVIDAITPLLDLGVGLITLGLVLSAFGFELQFEMGSGGKKAKKKKKGPASFQDF